MIDYEKVIAVYSPFASIYICAVIKNDCEKEGVTYAGIIKLEMLKHLRLVRVASIVD